jgi:hypothetical protein
VNPDTAWFLAIYTAACLIGLACFVIKVREWEQIDEERRRRDDADDFDAQLAAMTDDEAKRWHEWEAAQSDTPIFDATVIDVARAEAARLDEEWEALGRTSGGDAA